MADVLGILSVDVVLLLRQALLISVALRFELMDAEEREGARPNVCVCA